MTISFKKSRGRWTYDFRLAGRRFTGYCLDAHGKPVTSKSAAKQAEGVARRKAEIEPKVARANELTLAGAMSALVPFWERQSDWKNKKRYMKELIAFFGPDTSVASISEAHLQDYVAHALGQTVRVWTGGPTKEGARKRADSARKQGARTRSPATVNLYLHMMRQVFGRAAKIRDENGNPAIRDIPKVPVLDTPKRQARPVPDAVLSRAMDLLPAHSTKAVCLTLFFGFRKGEMFTLQKRQVDFAAGGVRLHAENVKDAEDAFLPGAPDAMTFLALLIGEADVRRTPYLITVKRKGYWQPIQSPKRAWGTAMKVIEREFGQRWRWHDIRAAFITQVALTSGPELARTMARHSDYKTTLGYVAVADEMRTEAARRAGLRPALSLVGSEKFTDKVTDPENSLNKRSA